MRWLVAFAPLAIATTAAAVGLGPLEKSGVTDGPGKAFYLTLTNPYPKAERFTAQPLALFNEEQAARVIVFPSDIIVAPGGRRQLLIIVRHLAPGESYAFRVCAQRPPRPEESVYARVCSKLVARRLPDRDRGSGDSSGHLPARAA